MTAANFSSMDFVYCCCRALGISVIAVLLADCGSPALGFAPASSASAAHANVRGLSATESVVYSFKGGKDGAYPQAALLAVGGEFYGTTSNGGAAGCAALKGCGTVYEVDTSGQERVVHAFAGGSDGEAPSGPLIDVNGNFYGVTIYGGTGCKSKYTAGCGTVYEIASTGKERVLYRFPGHAAGAAPTSSLTYYKGALYGEAASGGTGPCEYTSIPGCGLIFKMSLSGKPSILYRFKGGKDGGAPLGGLVPYSGSFYGVTGQGGHTCLFSYGCGTIFKLTLSDKETILHAFQGDTSDGGIPEGMTILGGAIYGATFSGGASNCAFTGSPYGCGTVFTSTLAGKERVLHNFASGQDGSFPNQVVASGGNLYLTTQGGGEGGSGDRSEGTFVEVTPSGEETVLYRFKGGSDGADPVSGLIESGKTFYGTTEGGGNASVGTVFGTTP